MLGCGLRMRVHLNQGGSGPTYSEITSALADRSSSHMPLDAPEGEGTRTLR